VRGPSKDLPVRQALLFRLQFVFLNAKAVDLFEDPLKQSLGRSR
jgi:hypothetical protein